MTSVPVLEALSREPCEATPVIVVGYDGSSESRAALTWALAEADKLGAAGLILPVLAPRATTFETPSVEPGWLAVQLEDARQALGEEARHAQAETHTTTVPVVVDAPLGHPASTLVDAA